MGFDVDNIKLLISKDDSLKYRTIEFENTMQRSNKFDKIDGICGEVNMGRVIFNEEDTEALTQIQEYVGAKSPHDDMPDCLAETVQRLDSAQILGTIQFFDPKKIFR